MKLSVCSGSHACGFPVGMPIALAVHLQGSANTWTPRRPMPGTGSGMWDMPSHCWLLLRWMDGNLSSNLSFYREHNRNSDRKLNEKSFTEKGRWEEGRNCSLIKPYSSSKAQKAVPRSPLPPTHRLGQTLPLDFYILLGFPDTQ